MRRVVKIKVDDPDDFWSHVDYVDEEGSCHITIKEGDPPVRVPTFTWEARDEELEI
jgi:hypothetical protein